MRVDGSGRSCPRLAAQRLRRKAPGSLDPGRQSKSPRCRPACSPARDQVLLHAVPVDDTDVPTRRMHAVILAPAAASRMGGPKALLTIGGETFLARSARLMRRPGVDRVTAFSGTTRSASRARRACAAGVATVVNPRHPEGMLTCDPGLVVAAAEGPRGRGPRPPVDHAARRRGDRRRRRRGPGKGSDHRRSQLRRRRGTLRVSRARAGAALGRQRGRGRTRCAPVAPRWIEHIPAGPQRWPE